MRTSSTHARRPRRSSSRCHSLSRSRWPALIAISSSGWAPPASTAAALSRARAWWQRPLQRDARSRRRPPQRPHGGRLRFTWARARTRPAWGRGSDARRRPPGRRRGKGRGEERARGGRALGRGSGAPRPVGWSSAAGKRERPVAVGAGESRGERGGRPELHQRGRGAEASDGVWGIFVFSQPLN
ncbi:hypothetical protein PVAP13_9KG166913 [Panicum virgatum]|uniref:Uncharacterized protein n=1 Tax=Panicum virgatum TaxID=38727 RepID=A0A8T0NKY4_PANVG|nr:hypothetical protein PVAP13_9KG166913 [Panicum virgatum]